MHARRLLLAALPAVLTTTVLTGLGAAPAHASDYCDYEDSTFPTVTGYSPSTVVVGVTPALVTFHVQAHDTCGIDDWSVSGANMFAYKQDPTDRIYGFSNSDAGTSYADVEVNDPAYNTTTKRFSFHLLRRATFKSSANATPEPIRKGAYLTVRGTLSRADWDQDRYRGYGSQRVQVQFSARGSGRWTTIKTVTAAKSGLASTRVKVTGRTAKDGSYRLHYAGNGVTGSATSNADYVDVR